MLQHKATLGKFAKGKTIFKAICSSKHLKGRGYLIQEIKDFPGKRIISREVAHPRARINTDPDFSLSLSLPAEDISISITIRGWDGNEFIYYIRKNSSGLAGKDLRGLINELNKKLD